MTPVHVVAPLFPDVTQLDLTGPLQVLSRLPGAKISLPWHELAPVRTDSGFSILPTATFDQAPQADILLIPGGQGVFALLEDPVVLDFVRRQAAGARYVTSVCTGSFLLGAAGLLQGKRATTHWASHALLEILGAIPIPERVVRDGNLSTGGGVTSGIDLALTVAAEMCGDEIARRIQLHLEYDPHPPFDAGSPDRPEADPRQIEDSRDAARRDRGGLVERAAARLHIGQNVTIDDSGGTVRLGLEDT